MICQGSQWPVLEILEITEKLTAIRIWDWWGCEQYVG